MARKLLNLGVYGSIPIDSMFEMYYDLKDGCAIKLLQTKSIPSLGAWIYDAAICLASYLESDDFSREINFKHNLQGRTLLELGAGTGLVGLVASYHGAKVIITDLEPLLPLIDLNISQNSHLLKASVCSMPLVWGSKEMTDKVLQSIPCPELGKKPFFDLIILANCIYYESSLEVLLETLLSVVGANSIVLACYEERTAHIKSLIDRWHRMASEHFTIKNIQLEESKRTNKYFHEYVKIAVMQPNKTI